MQSPDITWDYSGNKEQCQRMLTSEEDFLCFEKELIDIVEVKSTQVTLQRVISSECAQIQHDEFIALKSIFDKDLSLVDDDTKCFKITLADESAGYLSDEILDLWFSIPADYPNIPPLFELEGHGALSMEKADDLYDELLKKALSRVPETMLYDLIIFAKEYMTEHIVTKRLAQEDKKEQEDKNLSAQVDVDLEEEEDEPCYIRVWGTGAARNLKHLKPSLFTGPLHKFLERVPNGLQVATVENILRYDLAERFLACEERFNEKYFSKARKHPREYELKPTLGFHGTRQGNIPNIVRSGLVIPGENNTVAVAHGSCHGLGIYLSPDPEFSYGYCDSGGTVLVCSVLLGRIFKGSGNSMGKFSHDSLITECGNEIVIFSPSQVLPCYLIRLVRRESKERSDPSPFNSIPNSGPQGEEPETPREKAERLALRAKKFLPYGFGPVSAQGRKMVVEDVADTDDDEEEYGNYQTYRYDIDDVPKYE